VKAVRHWCYRQGLYALAYVWRRLLVRTTFVAVAGSVGKTTTKDCVAGILSARFRTAKTRYNQNDVYGVPRSILRVRPWHRVAVLEVATARPGSMRRLARLARPDVAIMLTVARTHTKFFPSLEATAAEKANLLKALPRRGLAILNADDPNVAGMAAGCRCRVTTFGRSPAAELWADQISSAWPSRLSLRVHTAAETQAVTTQLVGEHWVNSILAALLTAVSVGIDLRSAAEAIGRVEPFAGRMQPVVLPGGAVMIRDEYNASPPTLDAALRAFETFAAERRVLVTSGFSDSPENSRTRFRKLGEMARRVADMAVFISSEHAHEAVKAAVKAGMRPDRVRAFDDLRTAAEYLRTELRQGDLVLLKGRTTDHLSRLFFAQLGEIGCWKTRCQETIVCDVCDELRPAPAQSSAPTSRPR
jgi:UDP-N-acetylmuramoyl-tripeptide--D-alanyl-D-alanine ligase